MSVLMIAARPGEIDGRVRFYEDAGFSIINEDHYRNEQCNFLIYRVVMLKKIDGTVIILKFSPQIWQTGRYNLDSPVRESMTSVSEMEEIMGVIQDMRESGRRTA